MTGDRREEMAFDERESAVCEQAPLPERMVSEMNGHKQHAPTILSEARRVVWIETDCACSTAEADCDCACSVGDCACEDFGDETDGPACDDCACVDDERDASGSGSRAVILDGWAAERLAPGGGARIAAAGGWWQTGRPMVRQRLGNGWTAALSGGSRGVTVLDETAAAVLDGYANPSTVRTDLAQMEQGPCLMCLVPTT